MAILYGKGTESLPRARYGLDLEGLLIYFVENIAADMADIRD